MLTVSSIGFPLIHSEATTTNVDQKKKKNSGSKGGPDMNEVSFRARLHHNVHSTLEVDIGATGP
jgi:hypothetical protein